MSGIPTNTMKRRVRTGCLSCRKIHKKCDEIKPICTLCKKKTLPCIWPSNYGNMKKPRKGISKTGQYEVENKSTLNKENNLNEYADRLLESYKESSNQKSQLGNNSNMVRSNEPQRDILSDIHNVKASIDFQKPLVNSASSISISKIKDVDSYSIEREATINSLTNSISTSSSITNRQGSLYEFEPPNMNESSSPKVLLSNILNERSPEIDNKLLETENLNANPSSNDVSVSNTTNNNEINIAERNEIIENSYGYHYKYDEVISDDLVGDSDVNSFSSETFGFSGVYNDLHNTFRDYMFTNAELNDLSVNATFKNILNSPAPSFLNGSQKNLKDLLNNNSSYEPLYGKNRVQNKITKFERNFIDRELEIDHREELGLFKNYLYEVAPWLDMFDSSRKFGTAVVDYSHEDKALRYAMYAISSRQKEQMDRDYNPEKTISLYQESLKFLIPTVNKIMNKATISTCVILCAFEMMSSSPKFWRHHSEGCHALFEANDINGFSDELERSLFWCYARMDVNSAVIGEQQTIIPSESWLPKNSSLYESKRLFTEMKDEDMYANYIVFLCSRVLNLISSHVSDYEKEWIFLWKEVGEWIQERPLHFKPVFEFDDDPFPGVLFLNGPAVSANQLYHMAIILLIQNKPRLLKVEASKYIKSTIWHAKQICSISIHNSHHGCWNNALQPLWIAGKLLSSDLEHKIIIDLLNEIESTTGWQMRLRIKDLKKYWAGNLTE